MMLKHINMKKNGIQSYLHPSVKGAGADRRARGLMGIVVAGLLLSGCSAKKETEAAPTVTVQVDAENTLLQAQNAYIDAQASFRAASANLQTLTGSF